MEILRCYEDLAALRRSQLRPGVMTNCVLTERELRRELSAGRLYCQAWPEGLYLLRRRAGHWLLQYYLQPGGSFPAPEAAGPVVTEVPIRPKDAGSEAALLAKLGAAGFSLLLRRVRLQYRPAGPVQEPEALVHFGTTEDAREVLDLLHASLDPLTGCLPGVDELREDGAQGNLLLTRGGDGTLTGVLQFRQAPGLWEIRHLAVRADARAQGLGTRLLRAFLSQAGERRAQVWTGQTNAAALAAYQKVGFMQDGCSSSVLLRERTI